MRNRGLLACLLLLSACRLGAKFQGQSSGDMAAPGGDDMGGGDDLAGTSGDLAGQIGPDMAHIPQWTRIAMLPTSGNFYNPGPIWGSSATDLYVAAVDKTTNQSSIWHSIDVTHWTEEWSAGSGSSPPLVSTIWGTGAHNIYAVGARALLHTTGDGTWQDQMFLVPSGYDATDLAGIWGTGINDIYLGPALRTSDSAGGLFHLVQSLSFQQESVDVVATIWGSGPTDIYASGGFYHRMMHSIGDGSWQQQSALSPAVAITSIWGSGPNDIYAAGNTPADSTNATNAIFHSTGNGTWTNQLQNTTPLSTGPLIHAVYGTGPNDIYAAAPLMHTTGDGNWSNVTVVNSMNDSINGIWAASPTQVFVTAAAADGISSPILWVYQ